MDAKITKLGDDLMSLTTAEALQLQNYLESKGLVIAQPVAAPSEVKESVTEVKESETVSVVITKAGSIIALAKALMPRTGKGAGEIKNMITNLPAVVFPNLTRAAGNAMLSELANELDQSQYEFKLEDVV